MSDILEQILSELDGLGEAAVKLRSAAAGASRQTDLEVAILAQQVTDLREKNAKAGKFIEEATGVLEKLKKGAKS